MTYMAGPSNITDDEELYSAPDQNLIDISRKGDVLISIFDHARRQSYRYRVEIKCLRQASPYFDRLLDPDKFSEGSRVSKELTILESKYAKVEDIPADKLPIVILSDLGRISKVNTIKVLAADFFNVLHGQDLLSPNPPVPNLANLAIVADRFDTVQMLAKYVSRRKILQTLDSKTNRGAGINIPEERMRQKLLIGLLLDYAPWVTLYTKRLIIKNSIRWKPEAREDTEGALYWDMPRGIEDEMIQRREYILDTVQSLQSYFLRLYTHGERQCKLGYDTSPQCDSFQLGQMVRFFYRLDTFPLQGSIYAPEGPSQYQDDIERLVDTLRQCPEYQIDTYHRHCGLRERLLPALNLLTHHLSMDNAQIDIGICAECWQAHRPDYAWSEAKRPLSWRRTATADRAWSLGAVRPGESLCLKKHVNIRNIFMAVSREWTVSDT